ncbi:Amino acid permease [Lasiodiplodia theobromae]|uniref:Amino acid permease n=1 Tax=Lasiodiplodia theobromae TaxID=45133 RepID=UPI0015C2C638|nr:Amino acid permease [Lasiodiplodia theobromae]KAF4540694.1 Amino acid permease [Lasiodiplodia theobromae]
MPSIQAKEMGGREQEVQIDSDKGTAAPVRALSRSLQGRHMQMIAIGGSIGAGLFVGTGGALRTGGPGSLLIAFMMIGAMMMCTVQALGELAIIYPVNGAFYEYAVRFIDPAWGFAMGWEYSIGWMVTLPFEITAAGITIEFWRDREDINPGVWCAVFLVALIIINVFGVRGYGEGMLTLFCPVTAANSSAVEFILAIVKILACIGFIILGIIIDCGGVPTDTRGYIGARYWHEPGAFRNGFKGFCSVFVTAAFSFGGTEMVGLAAAEAANPRRSLPKATRQVFWRIFLFYILNVFIMGLVVPSDSDVLLGASGANTKASPFVLAVELAGIKALPHVINAVITMAVLSVANSCTYGSTRVLQALASSGRAPAFFAKVDSKGRPIWCVALQVAVGFLSFITVTADSSLVFTWLLAVTGLSGQFAYLSIMLAHIRFRKAWKLQGRDLEQIPWRSALGVYGSYVGLTLVCLSLAATFYSALFPIGSPPNANSFFQSYLAAPITLSLFIFWKVYTRDWGFGVNLQEVDLDLGRRMEEDLDPDVGEDKKRSGWRRAVGFIL